MRCKPVRQIQVYLTVLQGRIHLWFAMYFSCSCKKSTQKKQAKEALSAALLRAKDAPFGNPRPHRRNYRSTLTYIRIKAEMFRFLP